MPAAPDYRLSEANKICRDEWHLFTRPPDSRATFATDPSSSQWLVRYTCQPGGHRSQQFRAALTACSTDSPPDYHKAIKGRKLAGKWMTLTPPGEGARPITLDWASNDFRHTTHPNVDELRITPKGAVFTDPDLESCLYLTLSDFRSIPGFSAVYDSDGDQYDFTFRADVDMESRLGYISGNESFGASQTLLTHTAGNSQGPAMGLSDGAYRQGESSLDQASAHDEADQEYSYGGHRGEDIRY